MSTSTENQSGSLDGLKWALAALILIAAVVGNYLYTDISVLVRVLGVVIAAVAALAIASQTNKGKQAFVFAKESRMEVRKVIWPTRQEAIQTTMIVLAATAFMSLILWGLDAILVRLVAFVTGVSI
ncbi:MULTISPECIES: preprotein translocase subunit SecE [unclassified Agarivorans]|uniref:preprotein translocase subunit SecE n=1 Tax=unclassified Agarivorans TaxID=2636026 RepID=UPI003D7E0C2B